jgi:3-deoxy-D-manno-octulosonate 8-phosphate phosphatase (KDO 8-P phosphatase)
MKPLSSFNLKHQIKACLFDFDGIFTDNFVYVDEDGRELTRCSRYDGFGITSLKASNIFVAILTTEAKMIASRRAQKLSIPCFDNVPDKLLRAQEILDPLSINLHQCAYAGNDINDIGLLTKVLLPISPPDANLQVLSLEKIYITESRGGVGCVREICDFLVS